MLQKEIQAKKTEIEIVREANKEIEIHQQQQQQLLSAAEAQQATLNSHANDVSQDLVGLIEDYQVVDIIYNQWQS